MVNKYLIILSFILFSCGGTRKVTTQKSDSININNSYSEGSKIVLGSNITFTPYDNLKPFKVDGKEYSNVIVTNSKKKIVEKRKNKYYLKTITITKTKYIEKTDYTIVIIGCFVALVAGIIVCLKI
jgi:hypothetical protein